MVRVLLAMIAVAACGPSAMSAEQRAQVCGVIADTASVQISRLAARHDEIALVLEDRGLVFPGETQVSIRERIAERCQRWTPGQIACARNTDALSAQRDACELHDDAASQQEAIRMLEAVARRWQMSLRLDGTASCVLTGESRALHVDIGGVHQEMPAGVHLVAHSKYGPCQVDADLRRADWACESATVMCGCLPVDGADGCKLLAELCSIAPEKLAHLQVR